jgi:hypothetical protein
MWAFWAFIKSKKHEKMTQTSLTWNIKITKMGSKQILISSIILLNLINIIENCEPVNKIPIVINTWGFTNATIKAWDVLQNKEKTAVSSSIFDNDKTIINFYYFIDIKIK